MKRIGSKLEVYRGLADHTVGGIKKSGLLYKKGRVISKKKSLAGKKAIKHLRALGYIAKKGTFTLFRKSMAHGKAHGKSKKTRKQRK